MGKGKRLRARLSSNQAKDLCHLGWAVHKLLVNSGREAKAPGKAAFTSGHGNTIEVVAQVALTRLPSNMVQIRTFANG